MIDKKFERNVFKMFISNILIVLSGVISGFILPNILGVTGYGYYKIFNLYTTYIVFCDLGLAMGFICCLEDTVLILYLRRSLGYILKYCV